MATLRERPYSRSNFQVDLGTGEVDSVVAGFTEVRLPEGRLEAVAYRSGNEKTNEPRKLPGSLSHENLVLRRGVIGSLDLYEWWKEVRDGGREAMRTVTVQLLSEDRTGPVLTWRFRNAWPVGYGFEPLSTLDCGPAVEFIELAFEGMEIE
jgi:phage tail-like protein